MKYPLLEWLANYSQLTQQYFAQRKKLVFVDHQTGKVPFDDCLIVQAAKKLNFLYEVNGMCISYVLFNFTNYSFR